MSSSELFMSGVRRKFSWGEVHSVAYVSFIFGRRCL